MEYDTIKVDEVVLALLYLTTCDDRAGEIPQELAAPEFQPGLENWFLPYNLLAGNHRFRDVLQSRGYSVRYSEFSGGHDLLGWRGPFVEGLITLTAEQK